MEKLSHKRLLERADIKLHANIYTGEAVICYLETKNLERVKSTLNNNLNELALQQLESIITSPIYKYITCEKIAYAVGQFGNAGQLFNIIVTLENGDTETISTIGF